MWGMNISFSFQPFSTSVMVFTWNKPTASVLKEIVYEKRGKGMEESKKYIDKGHVAFKFTNIDERMC